jgi:hypothetical protein
MSQRECGAAGFAAMPLNLHSPAFAESLYWRVLALQRSRVRLHACIAIYLPMRPTYFWPTASDPASETHSFPSARIIVYEMYSQNCPGGRAVPV